MTGWELVILGVWGLAAGYSAVCIFVPEIRVYWKGSDHKLGTVSSVGVAMFIWSPTLGMMGVVPAGYGGVVYFLAGMGVVIAFVGYAIDVFSPPDK